MPKRRQSDNDNQMYNFLAVKEFLFIVLGRRKTVYIVRKLHLGPCFPSTPENTTVLAIQLFQLYCVPIYSGNRWLKHKPSQENDIYRTACF